MSCGLTLSDSDYPLFSWFNNQLDTRAMGDNLWCNMPNALGIGWPTAVIGGLHDYGSPRGGC